MRILVLDANQRAALAVTRSLGRAGYNVVVADERRRTLAGASRYSNSELIYPSPYSALDEFLRWADIVHEEGRFDVWLPISEVTIDALVRYRARWPEVRLPFAPIETIDSLSDKVRLHRRAVALGVPVPRTAVIEAPADVESAVHEIGFPAVLKPRRSRLRRGKRLIPGIVRRAANHAELEKLLTEEPFQDFPFLYQRQISGQARGVFALYGQGEAVAFFAHRRLREKPPEGGVSVLCESTALDPTLLRLARELLDDAGWHGVAMVEFKVSELEGPFLMEVNTRFWGSLQLAIDADIDFPTLLLQQELGEPLPVAPHYHLGRRLRWFLGDLDRLYLLISGYRGYGTRAVLRGLLDFILPRPFATRHEIFRWSDPRPAVRELQHYVSALGTE